MGIINGSAVLLPPQYDDTQIKEDIAAKAPKGTIFNINVPLESWSAVPPFTATIPVEGMVEEGQAFYDLPTYDEALLKEFAKITKLETKAGSIIITAEKKQPTAALNIRVGVLF